MDECEFCGGASEVDGIVDGNYVRLCEGCAKDPSVVVIKKPSKIQIDDSYKRPPVKSILSRMAGVGYNAPPKTAPTLAVLRQPSSSDSMIRRRLMQMSSPVHQREPVLNKEEPKRVMAKPELDPDEILDL